MRGGFLLLLVLDFTDALAVRQSNLAIRGRRPAIARISRRTLQRFDDSFDLSSESFDLISLRAFRRDALLQYEATNQSEPLRIILSLIGVFFALSFPMLSVELGLDDSLPTVPISAVGALGCGSLFVYNRSRRTARIEKICREYALGDLRATFRGVRTSFVRELRGKWRVVVLVGNSATVSKALREASVYRRRLEAAKVAVIPVYTDESNVVDAAAMPAWLWSGDTCSALHAPPQHSQRAMDETPAASRRLHPPALSHASLCRPVQPRSPRHGRDTSTS